MDRKRVLTGAILLATLVLPAIAAPAARKHNKTNLPRKLMVLPSILILSIPLPVENLIPGAYNALKLLVAASSLMV